MNPTHIRVGDVVVLKHQQHGPRAVIMTVVSRDEVRNRVTVAWFDGRELDSASVAPEALTQDHRARQGELV